MGAFEKTAGEEQFVAPNRRLLELTSPTVTRRYIHETLKYRPCSDTDVGFLRVHILSRSTLQEVLRTFCNMFAGFTLTLRGVPTCGYITLESYGGLRVSSCCEHVRRCSCAELLYELLDVHLQRPTQLQLQCLTPLRMPLSASELTFHRPSSRGPNSIGLPYGCSSTFQEINTSRGILTASSLDLSRNRNALPCQSL